MAVATPTKTGNRSLLAHTQQATATITVGSWVDVSTWFAARIVIYLGRTVATALTNEVLFRLEGNYQASGNDDNFFTIFQRTSASGKTAASSTTLNGATSANAATYIVTSATGIAAGDVLYLRETGTPANSEWSQVKSMSGTTVTPFNNLIRAHTNSINIADLGEVISWTEDLSSVMRVRLIVDTATNAAGQTVDVMAALSTLDSVTIA